MMLIRKSGFHLVLEKYSLTASICRRNTINKQYNYFRILVDVLHILFHLHIFKYITYTVGDRNQPESLLNLLQIFCTKDLHCKDTRGRETLSENPDFNSCAK